MIRAATYLTMLALAGPVLANDVPPSGLRVSLHETLFEPSGVTAATAKTMRLRYLAPQLADKKGFGFDVIEADFAWFCARDGLRFVAKSAPMVEQIIVSVASDSVPFGESAPNIVQYFDAFRVENMACIWEGL